MANRGVKHRKQWSRPGQHPPKLHTEQCQEPGTWGVAGVRVMWHQEGGRAFGEEHPVPTQRSSEYPIHSDACDQSSNRRPRMGVQRGLKSCPRAQAGQGHQKEGEPGQRRDLRTRCAVPKRSRKLIEARLHTKNLLGRGNTGDLGHVHPWCRLCLKGVPRSLTWQMRRR